MPQMKAARDGIRRRNHKHVADKNLYTVWRYPALLALFCYAILSKFSFNSPTVHQLGNPTSPLSFLAFRTLAPFLGVSPPLRPPVLHSIRPLLLSSRAWHQGGTFKTPFAIKYVTATPCEGQNLRLKAARQGADRPESIEVYIDRNIDR